MENWYTIYRCNPRQVPGTHGTGTPIVIFGDKPGTDVQLFPDIMQLVQETGTHIVNYKYNATGMQNRYIYKVIYKYNATGTRNRYL